jgi:hypothetical protein
LGNLKDKVDDEFKIQNSGGRFPLFPMKMRSANNKVMVKIPFYRQASLIIWMKNRMFAAESSIRSTMPQRRRRHRHSSGSWLRRLFSRRSHHHHYHHRSHHGNHSLTHFSRIKSLRFKIYSVSGESERLPLLRISETSRSHHHHYRHHHDSSGTGLPVAATTSPETTIVENWGRRMMKNILQVLPRLAISLSVFMVTYVIAWFLYQCAVIFTASFFNIHCVITYFEVMFTLPNSSPLWNELNIIAITASGPVFSLIIGFLCLILLKRRQKLGPVVKLFLIWLCLNAMAHFLGAFVAGAITWQGFGYVIAWMFMPFIFRLIVSFLFLAFMIYLGWMLIPVMHSLANSQMGREEIPWFLLKRFTLPWFIGSGLLMLLKIPNIIPQHENIFVYDVIILSSLVFAVVPILFIRNRKKPDHFAKKRSLKRRNLLLVTWLAVAVLVLFLYRYGLSEGFYVYMKFAIGISPYK